MKIALCQLSSIAGDCAANTQKILDTISDEQYRDADLFLFPELFIVGYTPRDLLDHHWFIDSAACELEKIIAYSKKYPEIAIITGTVTESKKEDKRYLYNSAVCIQNGECLFSQAKSLLSSYDIQDEYRYFNPAEECFVFDFKNQRIGITLCEDAWYIPELSQKKYSIDPVNKLVSRGANLILNISAYPFHMKALALRTQMITSHVQRHGISFVMLNAVGAHDEIIYDGTSLYRDNKGNTVSLPSFRENITIIDTKAFVSQPYISVKNDIELMYQALVLGVKDYFRKSGFSQALIGLSGGIDSAVTAAIAADALGKENLLGITLPSKYSSVGSIADSNLLAKNLEISCNTISIEQSCDSCETALSNIFAETDSGLAEENIQARIRGVLLMAVANKFSRLLLNTGNKSEMSVGYCTLYGDMNGSLSVLADVYKTDVYRLAEYINTNKIIIPRSTIMKAPSAELRPDQKDIDSLPPYPILDDILYRLLELDQSSNDIISSGYDAETVQWIVRAIQINEYKRRQAAPVLRVSQKAFGTGRRFPIAARYTW